VTDAPSDEHLPGYVQALLAAGSKLAAFVEQQAAASDDAEALEADEALRQWVSAVAEMRQEFPSCWLYDEVCDDCGGSGVYLIDNIPQRCICTEPQDD
jgi:hypothetical protein